MNLFFLLNGADYDMKNEPLYTERTEKIRADFTHKLQDRLLNTCEFDAMMEPFYDYEEELQHTCMEVGFKCGFRLALQLLSEGRTISGADHMAYINKAFSFDKERK